MAKIQPDLIGQRFGRLIIITDLGCVPGKGRMWEGLCDCGGKKAVKNSELKRGKAKSCGCFMIDNQHANKRSLGNVSFTGVLYTYKKNAKLRGYEFALTEEQFFNLTQQPCNYCGLPPTNLRVYEVGPKPLRYEFRYSGLDRVDNSRGYFIDNVVPCCRYCNTIKGGKNHIEFEGWLERVAKHWAINKL